MVANPRVMSDDLRLLVVDDEDVVCQGCRRIFSGRGFQVETSTDPRQGLTLATQQDFAVVLLDIKMPMMDGMEFLKELRRKKPETPVVFITGFPSVSSAALAVRLGAADYVTKPFTPEEITRAVERLLEREQVEAGDEAGQRGAVPFSVRENRDSPRGSSAEAEAKEPEPWLAGSEPIHFFEESWYEVGTDGTARVGALVAPSQGAMVQAVRFPQVGEIVYQGLPLAGLTLNGKAQRAIPSPISGQVIAVNPFIKDRPAALWTKPYANGWIARVAPMRLEEDQRNCLVRRVILANADPVAARDQAEQLAALGCQVQVATSWEAMAGAIQDGQFAALLLDAASLGELGAALIHRVHVAAPSLKVVVVAPSDSPWETSYREQRIFYYAVEPFADHEILEVLDAVFRPRPTSVPHRIRRKPACKPEDLTETKPEAKPMLDAIVACNRGTALGRGGESDQAIAYFTEAIRLSPSFARAYRGRALTYRDEGGVAQALADYTEAIRLDPNDAEAYQGRGITYMKDGGYLREGGYLSVRRQRCFEKAIADFTEAIWLKPKDPELYLWRGTAYRVRGDWDKAIADFTAAVELDPHDPRGYLGRARALQQKGETTKAEADQATARQLELGADSPVAVR